MTSPLDFNLDLFNERDEAQLHMIFWEYYAMLLNIAKKAGIDPDIAKDIVLNVFFRIRNNREKIYVSRDEIKANLINGVKYGVIDHFRKMKLRKVNYVDSYPVEPLDSSTEKYIVQKNMLSQVYQQFESLPHKRRIVFKMKYIQKLSNKEIAAALNIKVSTVKDHLNSGRSQILKAFESDAGTFSWILLFLSLILFFLLNNFL